MVSLFTSVPLDKALGLVLNVLSSDESLALRTSLDIPDITIGLEHCFCSVLGYVYIYNVPTHRRPDESNRTASTIVTLPSVADRSNWLQQR